MDIVISCRYNAGRSVSFQSCDGGRLRLAFAMPEEGSTLMLSQKQRNGLTEHLARKTERRSHGLAIAADPYALSIRWCHDLKSLWLHCAHIGAQLSIAPADVVRLSDFLNRIDADERSPRFGLSG